MDGWGWSVPFWMESDTIHDDPRWAALAAGRPVSVDNLQAAYLRLMSVAARHKSNGWLTAEQALEESRRRSVLELLASQPLGNQPPFLHTRKDTCECFDEWVDGYTYVLHWFLKRNPHKRETDRYRRQKAEREDPRIRAQVYERDGGCCRYCRSGPMAKKGMARAKDRRRFLNFDHVDPDQLAGDDLSNLVTACARCNREKDQRTPDEADMVLLPPPTDAERAAWLARAELLLDLPKVDRAAAADNAATTPSTMASTAPGHDVGLIVGLIVDDDVGTVVEPDDSTGEVRPEIGVDQPGQRPEPLGLVAGSGRVGQPDVVSATPQPRRTPESPDVYHRRSRDRPPADPPRCTVCRLLIDPIEGTTHPGCRPDPTGWPAGARPRPPP